MTRFAYLGIPLINWAILVLFFAVFFAVTAVLIVLGAGP